MVEIDVIGVIVGGVHFGDVGLQEGEELGQ